MPGMSAFGSGVSRAEEVASLISQMIFGGAALGRPAPPESQFTPAVIFQLSMKKSLSVVETLVNCRGNDCGGNHSCSNSCEHVIAVHRAPLIATRRRV